MRVDLFTTIHKGVRAVLFELSAEAARTDVTSNAAIDALVAKVDRALTFLDEHATIEDQFVWPVLRELDPVLADELAADHRGLDVIQIEVERAAEALALTDLSQRSAARAQLARVINHLIAVQLMHMNREETEVNATLWAGRADTELGAVRDRITGSIPRQRFLEWLAIVEPTLDPVERKLVGGARVA